MMVMGLSIATRIWIWEQSSEPFCLSDTYLTLILCLHGLLNFVLFLSPVGHQVTRQQSKGVRYNNM